MRPNFIISYIRTIAIVWFVSSCTDKYDKYAEEAIHSSLSEAVTYRDSVAFRLDTIASFEWDQFSVIHPYTNLEALEEEMAVDLSEVDDDIEYLDHYSLLVFLKDNEVVLYTKQGALTGILSPTDFTSGVLYEKDFPLKITKGDGLLTSGREYYYISAVKKQ